MNEALRAQLRALIDEMTATTNALRAKGIEPGQKEDREAVEILKRIIATAYAANNGGVQEKNE